jgi:hypothetical protein
VATAGAEAATAVVVAVSTEAVAFVGEVSAVAVSTVVAFVEDVSAVAVSTVVAFVGDVSAAAVSTAVAFVGDVSAVTVSTAVAFVATVLITDSLMMSSSAASVFRGGGAGAIRTDITVTAITRTVIMDTVGTRTATDTAGTVTTVAPVTDTARAADQGISGVREGDDMPGYGSLKSLVF